MRMDHASMTAAMRSGRLGGALIRSRLLSCCCGAFRREPGAYDDQYADGEERGSLASSRPDPAGAARDHLSGRHHHAKRCSSIATYFGERQRARGVHDTRGAGRQGRRSRRCFPTRRSPSTPCASRSPSSRASRRVVIFKSGALIISATAVPLQPGSVGEMISLRNTDSGTTIRGIVQADGTVRVGLP